MKKRGLIVQEGTGKRTSDTTLDRMMEAERRGITKPGEVNLCDVAHDDDCPALTDGDCACTPDLRITVLSGPRDGETWVSTEKSPTWRKARP